MAKNSFADLVRGYSESNENGSGKKFIANTITGSANRVKLTRFTKYLSIFFKKLTHALSYTSTRTYGALFTALGGLSLILHFVQSYVDSSVELPMYVIIVSSVLLLLGIPMLIIDKPLASALQSFVVTDYIFFEFFCIRRIHKNEKEKGIHFSFGIIAGILLSVVGIFVPFYAVIMGLIMAVYLFLTFLSPEFSFFTIFIAMPYLSFDRDGVFLAAMVAVTLISYARKVYLGKRVYFFEQYDLALFLMMLCILISGIFVKGVESFVSSVVMILLGCGYILSSSLVTNRRLADCLINAVIVSAIPVSVIAVVQAVIEISTVGFGAFDGVSATFDKTYTLAVFLLVSGIFSLYFTAVRRKTSAKILYFIIFLINFAALVATMRMWVVCVAFVGIITYAVTRLKRGSGIIITLLVVIPNLVIFMPYNVVEPVINTPVMNYFGFSDAIIRWRSVFDMLADNLFLGVGIGEECFTQEIIKYEPTFAYSDSGNFFLEIVCEAGIISLIAVLLILLIRVRHRAIYTPYVKNSQVSTLARFSSVSAVCFLVYGVFNSIWSDMTMYYLFWCIFGLGSAALRVSKQEFDDRVAYFSDGSAEDASSIDITIK